MRYWFGRLMCKLGWHWEYEGASRIYCLREGCKWHYNKLYDDSYEDYDG